MTEIDPTWFCDKCNQLWLDEEVVPDRAPDLIPFCPQCKERLEGLHEGDLLRNLRQEREAKKEAERERDELAHKLADKNVTELSYFFQDKELHEMASALASELEESFQVVQKARRVLGGGRCQE